MWKTCYFIPSICFGQFLKLFLPDFFVNFSSVGCDCNPISHDYQQQITFLQVHLWAMRNSVKSYRVLLLERFIGSQYETNGEKCGLFRISL